MSNNNVIRKWDAILSKWATEPQRCYQCQSIYYEFENIGRWLCSQHVATLDRYAEPSLVSADVYSCCGSPVQGKASSRFDREIGGLGCVRADHNSHQLFYTPNEDIPFPKGRVSDSLMLLKQSLIWDGKTGTPPLWLSNMTQADLPHYQVVRRYDWKEADRVLGRSHADYLVQVYTKDPPEVYRAWRP